MARRLALGFAHTGGTSDEWFLSDYLVVWMMNPSVTQMADAHFLYEAKYNGSRAGGDRPTVFGHGRACRPVGAGGIRAVIPPLPWLPPGISGTTDNVDWAYVKEQTDLPMLVRMDSGQFLRGSDLEEDGNRLQLYMWDGQNNTVYAAPGCEGSDNPKLTLDIDPALEGSYPADPARRRRGDGGASGGDTEGATGAVHHGGRS